MSALLSSTEIHVIASAATDIDADWNWLRFPIVTARPSGAGPTRRCGCRRTASHPTRDRLAGLVARLFPEERARHERTIEEARVLGTEGLEQLMAEEKRE